MVFASYEGDEEGSGSPSHWEFMGNLTYHKEASESENRMSFTLPLSPFFFNMSFGANLFVHVYIFKILLKASIMQLRCKVSTKKPFFEI